MKDFSPIIDLIRGLYPNRDFIPLHEPHFAGNEKKYLLDCIDSTFVSSVGKYVDKFEDMIREFTGAKYAIATVNGTAALHMALLLAGVKQGDLVITQPLTFIATCNAISYCGAEPVFIDIDRKTLGLSADALEVWLSTNAIIEVVDGCPQCYLKGSSTNLHEFTRIDKLDEPKFAANNKLDEPKPLLIDKHSAPKFVSICDNSWTRKRISACVPMHTFGHPCEIDRIVDICNRYHIPVVEDSAESIGSYYKGQHTGTFGKLGVLSFNGNKTITTGGGGMIITNDDELGKMAKHITTTAKVPHPWKFEHDMIGYNYRLPNINAALGCAQMELLPEILKNKRQTAAAYQEFFQNYPEIEFMTEPKDSISNYWLNVILLSDIEQREAFLKQTSNDKVMTRPAWVLMNELEMFKESIYGDLSISSEIADRLINIPSSVRKI
ncbi:MAG: LegC family aminotransferase [Candidatus Cloacimonetes bacterium]|nr:LegC family aminotransferase [Candidatus Cloacimonadota bacterium]